MKKTGNKQLNIFLNDKEIKKFKLFIKESELTQWEIGELEGEGYGQQTIFARLKKTDKIRRSFVKKVGRAKLKKTTQLIEKYKDFFENL